MKLLPGSIFFYKNYKLDGISIYPTMPGPDIKNNPDKKYIRISIIFLVLCLFSKNPLDLI